MWAPNEGRSKLSPPLTAGGGTSGEGTAGIPLGLGQHASIGQQEKTLPKGLWHRGGHSERPQWRTCTPSQLGMTAMCLQSCPPLQPMRDDAGKVVARVEGLADCSKRCCGPRLGGQYSTRRRNLVAGTTQRLYHQTAPVVVNWIATLSPERGQATRSPETILAVWEQARELGGR